MNNLQRYPWRKLAVEFTARKKVETAEENAEIAKWNESQPEGMKDRLKEDEIFNLCVFCRFWDQAGWDAGDYPGCEHPLEVIQYRMPESMVDHPSSDCWAFRPSNTIAGARGHYGYPEAAPDVAPNDERTEAAGAATPAG